MERSGRNLESIHRVGGDDRGCLYRLDLPSRLFLFAPQGKYSEAGSLFKRGFAIDEKVYGKDQPEVAADLNNIGDLMAHQASESREKTQYPKNNTLGLKSPHSLN